MSALSPDDLIVSYSTSVCGSTEKGKGGPTSTRFRWCSSWYFVMGSLCYAVSYTGYNTYGVDDRPGLVQYVIVAIFVGLPLFYTQTFLGQYCQMGMLNFRYMIPMARGLMYSFMICVILKTIRFGYTLTDVLLYLLMSFQSTLPWSSCPKGYEGICTGKNKSDSYPHTAYVFWRYIYAGDPTLEIDKVEFSFPSMFSMISFCLQWLLMFVFAVAAYERHRKITRILFYLHFSVLCTLIVTVFICLGRDIQVFHLLFSQTGELTKLDSWLLAVRSVVEDLCLSDLYNMYAGAHLTPTASSGTLSTGCVFAITFANFLTSFLNCICHYIIRSKYEVQLSVKDPYELGSGVGNILIVIPQGISYLTVPQWWCALFFTSCMCTLVSNQLLHLVSIQMTIADMYPNFSKYKTYLLAGCCIFGCAVGAFLHSKTLYIVTRYTLENTVDNLMVICVFIWSVTVYWFYGVNRLSDDVQFVMGVQPTKFWKITWYLNPAIFATMIVFYMLIIFYKNATYVVANILMATILIIPYLVFLVLELFVYIKKKNLLGIFHPHKRWGPPEPEERIYRKFFNPRTETKYQAHKMICHHKCLTTSQVLRNIVQQENALRSEYFSKPIYSVRTDNNDSAPSEASVSTGP